MLFVSFIKNPKKLVVSKSCLFKFAGMSSFVPFNVASPLEIMGFGQETGETFKKAWERVLEQIGRAHV